MENHPIPQDVTGFQFKLIGNMTVKQFAYLAVGVILAWVFLQTPIPLILKFPLSFVFAVLGISLAFLPVSGRPMDAMIVNFIKALLRPTEFVYEKTGGSLYFPQKRMFAVTPIQKDKLKAYLESKDMVAKDKVDQKENNFLMSLSNLTANTPTPRVNPISITPPANPPIPIKHADSPPPPIQKIIEQKPADVPAQQPFIPRRMPLSAPDSPNLIIGSTKDARGNALPNILVEVKDKEGNPIRAFKTNELGRFSSATPLMNGTYTIEFEDLKSQNRFEKITINVTGQIIQPIETTSIDQREELRQSLFSSNN